MNRPKLNNGVMYMKRKANGTKTSHIHSPSKHFADVNFSPSNAK